MIAGVLLAAGESTRMGQLKALLPWRGTTLLQSQLAELHKSRLEPVVVVLGHRAEELRLAIAEAEAGNAGDVHIVLNPRYREGKSTSIVAGVTALPDGLTAAIIVAVDQPCEAGVLRALIDAHRTSGAAVVAPSFDRRRGHPTLFDQRVLGELASISEEREGLRDMMTRHASDIHHVNVDSAIVRVNLNSSADYEAAFEQFGKR